MMGPCRFTERVATYLALWHNDGQFSIVQFGVDAIKHGILGKSPGALDTAARPLHQKVLHTSTFLILLDHHQLPPQRQHKRQ